jgi:hypothetical protein
MRTVIQLVMRACLAALLFTVPGGAAFALAIVDSSLTISELITQASGSASFELPLTTSATIQAFNSLGEEVFNGNSGGAPGLPWVRWIHRSVGDAGAVRLRTSVRGGFLAK